MKNIIGSALITLLTLSASAYDVTLSVYTLQGEALEQAAVGHPFLLEVDVDNAPPSPEQPTWQPQEGVFIHSSGFHMRSMNGVHHVTYQFRARVDQEGTYTLGPLLVGSVASNSVTVRVGTEEKVRGAKRALSKKDDRMFLRLRCDAQRAVVGQRIPAFIRFYAQEPGNVTLVEPDSKECAQVVLQEPQAPATGTEKIDGKEYMYVEWQITIYPKQAGNCTIPAYAVEYMPHVNSISLFNPFAGLMQKNMQPSKVYSNTVTLSIRALPSNAQDIQAIGHFTQLQASIDHTSAKVGDGVVLHLTVMGENEGSDIATPVLEKMPDSVKWYESKKYTEHKGTAQEKRIFEYILQLLQPGTVTIPVQHFSYYDTHDDAVKKLQTRPIHIVVTGSLPQTASSAQRKHDSPPEVSHGTASPLLTSMKQGAPWPAIPWWWFIFAVLLGGIVLIAEILHRYRKQRQQNAQPSRARLFMQARKHLLQAQETGNYKGLYSTFIALFSQLWGQESSSVTDESIERFLKEKNVTPEVIEQWNTFFEQLAACAYYDADYAQAQYPDLFVRSFAWLETLQELV